MYEIVGRLIPINGCTPGQYIISAQTPNDAFSLPPEFPSLSNQSSIRLEHARPLASIIARMKLGTKLYLNGWRKICTMISTRDTQCRDVHSRQSHKMRRSEESIERTEHLHCTGLYVAVFPGSFKSYTKTSPSPDATLLYSTGPSRVDWMRVSGVACQRRQHVMTIPRWPSHLVLPEPSASIPLQPRAGCSPCHSRCSPDL